MIRARLEAQKATLDDKAWALYEAGRINKSEFIELAGHKAFRMRAEESSRMRVQEAA